VLDNLALNHNSRASRQYQVSKVFYPVEDKYRPIYILHSRNRSPVHEGLVMLSKKSENLTRGAKEALLSYLIEEL